MEKETNWTYTMAFWLLRIWLAVRAIGTGLVKFTGIKLVPKEKYAGYTEDQLATVGDIAYDKYPTIGIDYYSGLPTEGPMTTATFSESILMPSWAVMPYANVLGYALIGLGIALLFGICTRATLFFMGLLYISLTYGFVILEKSMGSDSAAGIAYLGVHMIMIVIALLLADHDRFALIPCNKFKFCKKCCNK